MGFFGGSSVDLTSPGPIGSTTPNTGAFTTLSATPPANTTAFTSTGFSLTGTNAQTLLNLSGTWNTSGTPTAIKLNVTDTASNASSLLMDLQVGGSSRFSATKAGSLILPSGQSIRSNGANYANLVLTDGFGSGTGLFFGGYNTPTVGKLNFYMLASGEWTFQLNLGSSISWCDNSNVVAGTRDLILTRDAANTLAQRNSTNAQTFRLYNTFTDASNYERGFFRWNTNVLEIGAEAAGTGTQRQLRLPLGTVTASTPLSVTQTWNSAGVTFTGIQANITDTASASGSLLMDLQVGGSSKAVINKSGGIQANVGQASSGFGFTFLGGTNGIYSPSASGSWYLASSGNASAEIRTSGLGLGSSSLSWGSMGSTQDVILTRDAAAILAQRNSTNAQAFKLYRTFTDASNYERLGFLATNTTRYTITSENAGTGSARSLEVSFYTAASDPTSTDITSGCFSVWKNSGTGTIKLWANDGGTMKSVALA